MKRWNEITAPRRIRFLRWLYDFACRLEEAALPALYDWAYWEHRPDAYRQARKRGLPRRKAWEAYEGSLKNVD